MPGMMDLWPVLRPIGTKTIIEDIAVVEGHERGRRHNNTLRMGIHINALMRQIHQDVPNMAPVRAFFAKMCSYLGTPLIMICVFDGPSNPPVTHGPTFVLDERTRVACESLLKGFGFTIHRAPGDGRAELGALSEHGLVDYIVSPDSTIFAFGAKAVFRSNSVSQNPSNHRMGTVLYAAAAIQNTMSISLSKADIILIALLCGCEYTAGVGRCSQATARALARCGLAQALYQGCVSLQGNERRTFITHWIEDARNELRTNASGHLAARKPSLANTLREESFPSNEIIDIFVHPTTSFTSSPGGPDTSTWIFGEGPKVDVLAIGAINHLELENSAELSRLFHKALWRGVIIRTLLSPYQLNNPRTKKVLTPETSIVVEKMVTADLPHGWSTHPDWIHMRVGMDTPCKDLSLAIARGVEKKRLRKSATRLLHMEVIGAIIPRSYLPASFFGIKTEQ